MNIKVMVYPTKPVYSRARNVITYPSVCWRYTDPHGNPQFLRNITYRNIRKVLQKKHPQASFIIFSYPKRYFKA